MMTGAHDADGQPDGTSLFHRTNMGLSNKGDRPVYQFGRWEIDLARGERRVDGTPVPIGGRAFEIIEVLAQSAGELVTKDDLMARVWPGAFVEENTLQVHMSAIRKALGADRGMLSTTSGRGYCLQGTWTIRQERAPVSTHLQHSSLPAKNGVALAS